MGLGCLSFKSDPGSKPQPVLRPLVVELAAKPVVPGPAAYPVSPLYAELCLEDKGLSAEAFAAAWKGYQRLLQKGVVRREQVLTICDFSQSSSRRRLYIIDVNQKRLLTQTYVAHGRNSGGEYASRFSNTPESLQSSLGFYVTRNTYQGAHGLSLRLEGVDPGFNDKALERTIVLHGATYVDAARARSGIMMGRSFGCPAVPQQEATAIIGQIKDGTCLFIYHPSAIYHARSNILND